MSDIKRTAFDRIEAEIQKERAEALGRAGERLEQALRELIELIIQREANGLRRHEDVDRHYPIPHEPAWRGEAWGEERR